MKTRMPWVSLKEEIIVRDEESKFKGLGLEAPGGLS